MVQIEAETEAQNMICAGIPEVTASLAMDSGLVSKLEGLRDDQTVGIQVRARKMLDLLTSAGLVYEQLIPCTLLRQPQWCAAEQQRLPCERIPSFESWLVS